MTAAPSPRTWVDGEIPPVDTINQELYETWYFLLNPPMVKARQTVAQTMTNVQWTALNFQVEDVDTHGFHSSTVNPSRFTPTVPGFYVGYAGASFAANVTGRRLVRTYKNGTTMLRNARSDSLPSNNASADLVIKGVAFGPTWMNGTTDYLEVMAYQSCGGNMSTRVGSGTTDYEEQPEFYMRWWSS